MPDDLSVFPVADAGYIDVLDHIYMDSAWREQTHVWNVSYPRRGGHDALDVTVTSSSASCAGRRVRADLGAARRFAFSGMSPCSASDCSQAREGSTR